ncbi:MAG: Xaa-Pro aminopeptidase [Rhodothermales bacterium]
MSGPAPSQPPNTVGLDRLASLRSKLSGADALLITSLPDIRWATGFSGSNAVLVVREGRADFVTDGRYRHQASREVRGADVHVPEGGQLGFAVRELLAAEETVRVQPDVLTLAQFDELTKHGPEIRWSQKAGLLESLRATKDEGEIQAITTAQRLTENVFNDVLPAIKEGMTEKDLAAELVFRHLQGGAERMSFDPIVSFGPNAALPHGRPGPRALRNGDPILIDMGGFVEGYASDMTRMVSFGKPSARFLSVFNLVREALQTAHEAARSGMRSCDLDAAARDVITAGGYEGRFSHSLGHGVGLEIHEAPAVSYRSTAVLPEAAAITLEPGIYLDGEFGVRIEDIVVLRPGGSDTLTNLAHDLVIL